MEEKSPSASELMTALRGALAAFIADRQEWPPDRRSEVEQEVGEVLTRLHGLADRFGVELSATPSSASPFMSGDLAQGPNAKRQPTVGIGERPPSHRAQIENPSRSQKHVLTPYIGTEVKLPRSVASKWSISCVRTTMTQMTISKLAKEAGVSVETIRFYERIGLLTRPATPTSGWRKYSEAALAGVRYIKISQQLGFTLSELDDLQLTAAAGRNAFCGSVRSAALAKIQAVEEQITKLQAIQRELQNLLTRCGARAPSDPCPIFDALRSMRQLTSGCCNKPCDR